MVKIISYGLTVFCALFFSAVISNAYTITDNYWGGMPNHSGYNGDIIGEYSLFGVDSMDVSTSGSLMTVVIHTPYANAYLSNKTDGFAPGDLFISTNGWNPYGIGPQYIADTGSLGEKWEFGVNGSGIYTLAGATINPTNLNGLPANQWVFRDGQEWTFSSTANSMGSASMIINGSQNTITYVFDISGMGLTGTEILGFHWTMQCGNDVIEGAAPVPEPATMILLGSGLVGLAGFMRKFRKT